MPINQDTLNNIISGLGAMPRKSEIDTPTNNIDLIVTETEEGLMSAEDKVKLNNIESGANNYILPVAGSELGGVKTISDISSIDDYDPVPIIDGVPYYHDTVYKLPIATINTLGGIKIGKNISISDDGAISVSDVSADQMTGIVPITKGGTGAQTAQQARLNLKTSCFVIAGNTTDTDETNNGYYRAFTVSTPVACFYTLRLLISPITTSYNFEEFVVNIVLDTTSSRKNVPIGYTDAVKERYDVLNKLYISYDSSTTTGGYYFWYKNPSAKSMIRISVLQCTCSNDILFDGLQAISLNTNDARTSVDTISTITPDVVSFDEIISTKLVSTTMAGYMTKEDKIKLDALDSTLTEQAEQLTTLVNDAYNVITDPIVLTEYNNGVGNSSPYRKSTTTRTYTFTKPNGGSANVFSTDTIYTYNNASSNNDGLLTSTDYDYIHSLPDTLTALEEAVTNDITTTLNEHVSDTNNPHSVTKAQIGLGNVENKTSATIRNEITKANVTTALGYAPVTPTEFTTHIDEFDAHVANVSNPHSVTKAQIGLGNVENKTSEDIRGEITSTNVIDALEYTPAKATDLTSHISNKSNPHSVTKAQVGLSNVENKSSEDIRGELTATNVTTALGYTPVTPTEFTTHTDELDAHVSDTNNPHSVTKAQIGLSNVENKTSATIRNEITKANVTTALGYAPVTPTDLSDHISDNDNPHSVTKAQVGLSNVENKSSEDIRGELTATNVTTALGYTPAKATDLTSHISNKSNPHSVTKAQIGLGNVENKTSEDIRGELTATDVTTALGYTPVTPTDLSDHMSDTNNPHGVTKAQIGLGNVENKSSATIRGELTKANVTTALGYTPPSSVAFTQSLTSGTKVGTLNISGTDVDLYAPTNTDTHWTTKLVVGASDTASANAAASNGNVYLNIFDNTTLRNAHKISGTNGVSVTSDSNGNITITGTTYSSVKNPYALELQFNGTTQASYDGSSAKTLNITPASIGASADDHTHDYLPLSGGTLTGQLIVLGLKESKPIVASGIAGSDGNGNIGNLYLQYGANSKIFLGNTGGYTISADGSQYSGNSASATKLTTSAGSATQPIYFSGGTPVACTYTLEKSVPSDAEFTDTHYTTHLYAGASDGITNAATTNGDTYLILTDNTTARNRVKLIGSKGVSVASDANGVVTITGTTYSALKNPNALSVQGNGTTLFTYDGSVAKTLNIKAGSNVTVTSDTSGNITIASSYENTKYNVATSSELGLVKSGTDITVDESGNVSVNDDSHNHVISNIDGLQSALNGKSVIKTLSSEDLNSVTTPGFYNAGSANTVTNKPSGIDHFGLIVINRALGSYYTQILFNDESSYRRFCVNGTWGSWTQDKLTDTHYTSKNVVGSSSDTTNTTTALTNGNVCINSVENGAITSSNKISGSGMSTVTTDTSGNIIVTATHPTSAGNKHIPSGGANGDTLMYSASGTAVWHNDYVVGTQTSSTNEFTGILSGVSALYDGLSIRYYLPYAGTTSAATLKLTLSASGTTTSAIPIYRNNGNTFTNQCGAGSILYLTYRTATNRWTMSAQYDYDTYDRLRHNGSIKCNADTAIVANDIIVAKNGVYYPLKTGTEFDITQPILYSGVNIAVNATSVWTYYSYPAHVTTTQSITLTAYKPLFIKGTLSGNTFTPISATPLTQTIPTSDDGYQYILLGSAYDGTHFHMMPEHPIFAFKGGTFGQISSKGITDLSVSGKTVTYTRGDGTTGTITTQDTVTTVTTSGSGNAVTAIAASNGALTVTKGATFLTAHPTITKSTDSTSTASPTHGGTFTVIDSVTRDGNGHVTKVNTKTITLPADNNTDTKVTNAVGNTTKAYLTGTTNSATNTGTQVFDTGVYITTTAGQMNATSYKVAEKVTMQYNTSEECLKFVFS